MTSAWKWSDNKLHPDHAVLLCRAVNPVAVMDPFAVVALANMRRTDAANASSKTPAGTAAASVIRSTAVTWGACQGLVSVLLATRPPCRQDRTRRRHQDDQPGVPVGLPELSRLGRTLKPAYFDRPGTSNGPTEAINGRREHLRGTALGFRDLTNHNTRSLLDADGFRSGLTHYCDEPDSVNRPVSRHRRPAGSIGSRGRFR